MTSDALRRWHEATCGGVGWPLVELWVAYGLNTDNRRPKLPLRLVCSRHPRRTLGSGVRTEPGVLIALWGPGSDRAAAEQFWRDRGHPRLNGPAEMMLLLITDARIVDRHAAIHTLLSPAETPAAPDSPLTAWCPDCGTVEVDEQSLAQWAWENRRADRARFSAIPR